MADINLTEEQARQVAAAQARFIELKAGGSQLGQSELSLLFNEGRSQNGWSSTPVSDETLEKIYSLTRMGATSMNCCPARIVFVRSDEGKEKIKPTLAPGNVDKVMTAPVVAVIGYDTKFYTSMGYLLPHMDVAPMFSGNELLAESTAFRNGTLQGAYLMLAARALGLDCGPMSGFDNGAINEAFFAETSIKSNFLCCLGYGDPHKIFQRLPRLSFSEACELA